MPSILVINTSFFHPPFSLPHSIVSRPVPPLLATLTPTPSSDDMYAQDSIELLQKSGIDFARLETDGIENEVFAEHLITSGLVLFENVKWVSFHS